MWSSHCGHGTLHATIQNKQFQMVFKEKDAAKGFLVFLDGE